MAHNDCYEYTVHRQVGIDLPFDAGDGTHKLLQSLGGQILPLHRNDNAVRRCQCDGFQKHTSISCNKKRAFRLLL